MWTSETERKRELEHRRWAQRRANGSVEKFHRRKIYERDGWACQLCGEPVDRTGLDMYLRPSLDHIVPLSKGGTHTRANAQCAHWICNSLKGAKRTVAARG